MNKPEKKSSSNKSANESESTFKDLDLTDEMMKALERAGYEIPSPVQAGVIPPALEGFWDPEPPAPPPFFLGFAVPKTKT